MFHAAIDVRAMDHEDEASEPEPEPDTDGGKYQYFVQHSSLRH